MNKPILIKIGGHEIADPEFLQELAQFIKKLERPAILVHGGGKEISAMQERLGIVPRYINGVRVTDAASLEVVTMVLCGVVNKRLVHVLNHAGVDACGLSGVDRRIVQAKPMSHDSVDMGYTGEVAHVRDDILCAMMEEGITPIIAPICAGETSNYNVNADHVAGAVAAAINAERIVFLTNVEGVLVENAVLTTLTETKTQNLIADGTIFGGMIPKVNMALHALHVGIPRAVITNLAGLKTHGGTVFSNELGE